MGGYGLRVTSERSDSGKKTAKESKEEAERRTTWLRQDEDLDFCRR